MVVYIQTNELKRATGCEEANLQKQRPSNFGKDWMLRMKSFCLKALEAQATSLAEAISRHALDATSN